MAPNVCAESPVLPSWTRYWRSNHSLIEEHWTRQSKKLRELEAFCDFECAMLKSMVSEILDICSPIRACRFYGGLGIFSNAPMERAYRVLVFLESDEGTTEFRNCLLVGMASKASEKVNRSFWTRNGCFQQNYRSPSFDTLDTSELSLPDKDVLKKLKRVFLMVGRKKLLWHFRNKIGGWDIKTAGSKLCRMFAAEGKYQLCVEISSLLNATCQREIGILRWKAVKTTLVTRNWKGEAASCLQPCKTHKLKICDGTSTLCEAQ